MPSFGVIARRLGELATGINQGRTAQEQLYKQENRQALDFSLQAGAAGIDPSLFTDEMYTKGNPFAGTLKDKSSVFLSPYETAQAAAAAAAERENRKIAVDEQGNVIKANLGVLNADTQFKVAQMNNAARIKAANISAAAQARAAGTLAKGAASWGNMENRDQIVKNAVLRQMMSRGMITKDEIATDDDGNWTGVANADKADAYEALTNGFYQYLDRAPNTLAVDISPMIGMYLDENAGRISKTDASSWLNPLDWVSPDEGLAVNGKLTYHNDKDLIADFAQGVRGKALQIDNLEARTNYAKEAMQQIMATYPDASEEDLEFYYQIMLGD